MAIITPEGNIEILAPGSKETGIVFEGETAIDDAIDYLTGNADAEDVPSGEGETLPEFNPEVREPSEPIEQDTTTLEDPEFPDEGLDMIDTSPVFYDMFGNPYSTAEEAIAADNSYIIEIDERDNTGGDGEAGDIIFNEDGQYRLEMETTLTQQKKLLMQLLTELEQMVLGLEKDLEKAKVKVMALVKGKA